MYVCTHITSGEFCWERFERKSGKAGKTAGKTKKSTGCRICTLSQVFDRARAYLRGYLAGGYVEAFFRVDLPKLELTEDAVYHALIRGAPDLDSELATPLARAGETAIGAVSARLQHWAGVADVTAYDLEISLIQLLDQMSAALAV